MLWTCIEQTHPKVSRGNYPCPLSKFQSLVCHYFGRFPHRCQNFNKTPIACCHVVALMSLFQGLNCNNRWLDIEVTAWPKSVLGSLCFVLKLLRLRVTWLKYQLGLLLNFLFPGHIHMIRLFLNTISINYQILKIRTQIIWSCDVLWWFCEVLCVSDLHVLYYDTKDGHCGFHLWNAQWLKETLYCWLLTRELSSGFLRQNMQLQ